MGRKRKHRLDLPERVYFNHGAYYFVHPSGKWEKLDNDYAKAMSRWAELLESPTECVTVSDLLNRYLLEVVPGKAPRTQEDNRQEIRFLRSFFGDMAITQVAPQHIVAYVNERRAKTRANREVALLSNAFNKARLWGVYDGQNPCSVPGIRNSEKARNRYVTDEEIEKFKEVAPEWLANYVELKLMLGLRKQDMLCLSWSSVTENDILVMTRKTSKPLRIVLTEEVKTLLDRLPKNSKNLFATRSGSTYTLKGFNSTWQRTMAKYESNGNERFHEHDLRGKVATDIADPIAAKALLGHSRMSMTEAYIKQRTVDTVQPHSRRSK
jgi:integrase